jgi:hypothetical protein
MQTARLALHEARGHSGQRRAESQALVPSYALPVAEVLKESPWVRRSARHTGEGSRVRKVPVYCFPQNRQLICIEHFTQHDSTIALVSLHCVFGHMV